MVGRGGVGVLQSKVSCGRVYNFVLEGLISWRCAFPREVKVLSKGLTILEYLFC